MATFSNGESGSSVRTKLNEIINKVEGTSLVGNDIKFGDNAKAIFGAGSDLQIFHDPLNGSFISDQGVGSLNILASTYTRIKDATGANTAADFNPSGGSAIYYANGQKLATTSTGVDVTGTVTADGLVTDTTNGVKINTSSTVEASWTHVDVTGTSTINVGRNSTWGGELIIQTDTKNRANFASNGDISFYEDTGTTAKFFWDASAESLGIKVTDPIYPLEVQGEVGIELYNGTGGGNVLNFRPSLGDANKYNMSISSYDHSGGGVGPADGLSINGYDGVSITTGSTTVRQERLRIDSSGSVGIGTSLPNTSKLHVQGTTGVSSAIRVESTSADSAAYYIADNDASVWTWGIDGGASDAWILSNAFGLGTPKMTVTTSGNVGIGTTSPASIVGGTDTSPVLSIGGTDSGLVVGDKSGSLSFITNDPSYTGTYADGVTGEIASISDSATGAAYGLAFYTGTTTGSNRAERLRIDSSGNLLVGTTTILAAESNVEGISLAAGSYGGLLSVSRDGNRAATFNRKTSDGDILQFRKDGAAVGSIGTTAGYAYYNGSQSGIDFYGVNALPTSGGTNVAADGVSGLGNASFRWKDLYLSGGVYLGGTGAANLLDDYEEGTFTPTTASDATGVLFSAEGFYTKTGRLVTIQLNVTVSTNFTSNIIGGLPFSVANLASITAVGQNSVVFMLNQASYPVFAGAFEGSSTVYLYIGGSGSNHYPNTSQGTYRINLSYITA